MKITFSFYAPRKRKMRTLGKGTARAQLAARDPKRGVTVLGSPLPPMTGRQYRASKKAWS